MALEQPFSKRNRYSSAAKEITVREDAPESLRYIVLQTAIDLGWGPSSLRPLLCRVLRVPPDESNWSEYPNIWGEVQGLMYRCEWFKVYDILRRCTPVSPRMTESAGNPTLRNLPRRSIPSSSMRESVGNLRRPDRHSRNGGVRSRRYGSNIHRRSIRPTHRCDASP